MAKNYVLGWAAIILLTFISHASAVTYSLTLVTNGPGTIGENPASASYPAGVTVTLTATPGNNALFTGWSGDITGTINPTNVTMNSSMVITGNFSAANLETITLITNGQGTIALNPAGGTYASNTVVTLTANPAAGWLFTSWSGDTNTTTNPLTLTLTNNLNVTGNFAQLPAFDIQPFTVSNSIGSNVNFTAHAVGSGTLAYQWYFSGIPLSGATSASLNLPGVQPANAGNYYVIATNAYGTATSATAALVLTNLPGSTNAVNICTEANLRAAIAAGGWVSIHCNGPYNLTGTINITNHVILDASGFNAVINGGGTNRLFYIASGASLAATNLVFANGSVSNATPAFGGAIYNNGGSVSLTSCLLTNNYSIVNTGLGIGAHGGAIANASGMFSLYNCSLSNNIAIGLSSLANFGYGDPAFGGAIYNTNGSLSIIHCILNGNLSSATSVDGPELPLGGYGGAVYQVSGTLMASYDLFAGNIAYGTNGLAPSSRCGPSAGGAISADGGSVTIYQCQFLGNTAHGGDIRLNGSSGSGGAVYSAGRLAVDYSTFAGNSALSGYGPELSPVDSKGGAIFNAGSATFNHTCIFSNLVQGSAGNDQVMGGNPVSGGNGLGGGIFNSGSLAITNCTVALNSAIAGAGGYNYNINTPGYSTNGNAFGGGLFNSLGANLVLMNATFANNSAIAGGFGLPPTNGFSAGDQIANTNGGYVSLRNSLLAYAGTNGNTSGIIVDGGYNFSSDGSANFSGGTSFNFTDPQLSPLADNGGPTLTMALAASSPAIDYGSDLGAPNTDQRGFARPIGAGVDCGAYEYGSHPSPWLNLAAASGTMLFNFPANAGYIYRLQSSSNLVNWTDIATNGPTSCFTNFSTNCSTQTGPHWFYRLLVQ